MSRVALPFAVRNFDDFNHVHTIVLDEFDKATDLASRDDMDTSSGNFPDLNKTHSYLRRLR